MKLSLRKYIDYIKLIILSFITTIIVLISNYGVKQVIAISPIEDIPEEILRTEIITVGRSPIDGKLLTAAEYAELQVKLQTSPPPELNSQVRDQVFLLRLRKALLQIFPFLGI